MKKRGGAQENKTQKAQQKGASSTEEEKKELAELNDDTHNQGFGEWLRSSDGVEMMRLFVIANSILVFVTMAWPNMQQSYDIIKDYFTGEEEE